MVPVRVFVVEGDDVGTDISPVVLRVFPGLTKVYPAVPMVLVVTDTEFGCAYIYVRVKLKQDCKCV